MRNKIFKMMISIILIITLTSVNFLLLGFNVVKAVEQDSQEKATSHKNIEFMAYFKEGEKQVSKYEAKANVTDAKLYLQIAVKQEGYFNGKVTLENSNFKFKTDTKHERIQQIKENEIVLNQITAGETVEIPVGITILTDTNFDIALLEKESKIQLKGTYTYGSKPDIKEITGERKVTLQIVSPYEQEKGILLSQTVLTNKVFQYENAQNRVIQLQIESGIENNLYPVKNAKIELQAPTLKGNYPTKVIVQTPEELATNGETITEKDYIYDSKTGKTTITIENKEKDGKVEWKKAGNDRYIVTYIYSGTEMIEEQGIEAKAEIELYDTNKTTMKASNKITLSSEEKDSIIAVSLNNTQNEIYKGAIYEGIEKEVTQNINIQVNLQNIAESIKVEENTNSNTVNIQTKKVQVNIANLVDILGQEGIVTIKNKETGEILTQITKTTSVDKDQNAIIALPAGIKAITVETTKPVKSGILTIGTTKGILAQNKQAIQNVSEIEFTVHSTYKIGEVENTLSDSTAKIELKETQTYATLDIRKKEFSTMLTNENVEMRVVLHSNEEKYELYKNPHIVVTIPDEFKTINVKSINLLNEDEMVIQSATKIGNTIDIQLQGEQTKYKNTAIEGVTIIIVADLATDKRQTNADVQFTLQYENQKAIHYPENANTGIMKLPAQIVSYAGLITTNKIAEYGIESVNNEGNKTAKLELSAQEKTATISAQIINNHETAVTGVAILGTFPTKTATEDNNLDVLVDSLQISGIDANRVKIYYSENAEATKDIKDTKNQWKETITDPAKVKKYLISVDNLQVAEEVDFAYTAKIPENLGYNKTVKENYIVTYATDVATEQKAETPYMILETGVGPEVTTILSANIGTEATQVVKEGGKIEYRITAKNTGSEPVKDVQLIGQVPEGTVYVESVRPGLGEGDLSEEGEKLQEDAEKKEVIFDKIELAQGEEITKNYTVKVKTGTANTTISNKAETRYGEVKKESNIVETKVEPGSVEINIVSGIRTYDNMNAGDDCIYVVRVKNISGKDLKNVKIAFNTENMIIKKLTYLKGEDLQIVENPTILTIEQLADNQEMEISVYAQIEKVGDKEQKSAKIQPIATVDNVQHNGNIKEVSINALLVQITNTSQNPNQYVKAGDNITYKIDIINKGNNAIEELELEDKISAQEEIKTIQVNGVMLTEGQYQVQKSLEDDGKYLRIEDAIGPEQTKTYLVTTEIDPVLDNAEAIEIKNIANVLAAGHDLGEANVTHIVEPSNVKIDGDVDLDELGDENGDPNGGAEGQGTQQGEGQGDAQTSQQKLISGTAWLDENEDGIKDDDEPLLEGIQVRLLNTETNEFQTNENGQQIKATTNSNGTYTLSEVPQGNYIVVFEFDNTKYAITTYEQEGVSPERTSKVISTEMEIDGQEKTVAVTEGISVEDEHISYINMGLKERKIYDMKIEKMISRVVIQNENGTETKQFPDSTLAKVEINSKLLSNTNVVVEYKIRVTNEGEIDGYIQNIEDYVSADYNFSSELNTDWYQSGTSVCNSSLENERLAPGESREVTLTLTKQMTENNTGLITNCVEIAESYNEEGIADMDSTEANRAKGEDDMASADLIISIKTGEIVATITIIITTIAVLGIVAFVIIRKVMKPVEI